MLRRALVETEPVTDERLRTIIDEELNTFNVKQGDAVRKLEDLNAEFLKQNSSSLTHRAEGTHRSHSRNPHPPTTSSLAAKVMLLIDPTNNLKALEFLTTLDPNFTDQNLKVSRQRALASTTSSSSRSARASTKVCKQVNTVP